MIFYFSGTGNSEHAAKKLLQEGERLISIAEAVQKERFTFWPWEDENVGFVFPVYFYGLPDMVRTFVRKLNLMRKPAYTYAVITCGGSIGAAGDLLRELLAEKDIPLRAVYKVKMPDNYVLMYDIPSPAQQKQVLAEAEVRLDAVARDISQRRFTGLPVSAAAKMKTAAVYPFYDKTRKTAKFHVDETCVSCGKCAANCPDQAIELKDGVPTWVKDKCQHCLRCMTCNAISFGKRTVGKPRYRHPDKKQKMEHTDLKLTRRFLFKEMVEIDEEATKAWYAQAENWGCDCGDCRNFLAVAEAGKLPEPVMAVLQELGIPAAKATYVCLLYHDEEGYLYQFSYRIAGNIVGEVPNLSEEYPWGGVGCGHEIYPYGAPDFPEPHFDLEFGVKLPWVLEEPDQ